MTQWTFSNKKIGLVLSAEEYTLIDRTPWEKLLSETGVHREPNFRCKILTSIGKVETVYRYDYQLFDNIESLLFVYKRIAL